MFRYSIDLAWSDEDGGYIATIPELPGLSAFGETPEEAVEEAKIAASGFLEVYEEDGDAIPEPFRFSHYSGQTRLRLPKSLHAALVSEARREGVSLNSYIQTLLAERHMNPELSKRIKSLENVLYSNMLQTRSPATGTSGNIFTKDQWFLSEAESKCQ